MNSNFALLMLQGGDIAILLISIFAALAIGVFAGYFINTQISNKKKQNATAAAKKILEEAEDAANKAKKDLITVPIVNETIPHEVETKVTGANVLMKPAAPGTGVIAGGVVRSIIGLTSIRNLISKSLGSTNKVNIAYATIEGLKSLVPREQWLNTPKKVAKKEDK